jgi:RsiW-degrading membrane proteinase PrsW (M82 family)
MTATVDRARRSIWRAGIVEIAGLLAYVGLAELVVVVFRPTVGSQVLLPVGIVLSLIPAAIWLAFFHAQDRAEPEPRQHVLAVSVLGALLAIAIGQPFINDLARAPQWLDNDTLTQIVGSILIVGVVQEFLKYAAVRYSIYHATTFNERVDGVLYGTAAGLGYATVLNVSMIVSSDGIAAEQLSAGVIRIVIVALVQASLGGLVGYFIARDKFDARPLWWMPAGLMLAAVMNGMFSWLAGEVTTSPLTLSTDGTISGGYTPWPALILAAILASALLMLTFALMQRAAAARDGTSVRAASQPRAWRSALLTLLVAAGAVIAGLLWRDGVESRTRSYTDPSGLIIQYPARWQISIANADLGIIQFSDLLELGYPTTFEVRQLPVSVDATDGEALTTAANTLALNRARDLTAYRLLELESEQVLRGLAAARATFAFVHTPANPFQDSLPVIVLGEDIMMRKGDRVFVFSLFAAKENYPRAQERFRAFVEAAQLP